jgi:hypothetical protein
MNHLTRIFPMGSFVAAPRLDSIDAGWDACYVNSDDAVGWGRVVSPSTSSSSRSRRRTGS